MNLNRDIQSLTDFKRKTPEFLRRLKETGHPLVLTVNGRAEVVVQDAASYRRLFELAERLETIPAVKEGLASADRGEGGPMNDVFDAIEQELRRAKAREPRRGSCRLAGREVSKGWPCRSDRAGRRSGIPA